VILITEELSDAQRSGLLVQALLPGGGQRREDGLGGALAAVHIGRMNQNHNSAGGGPGGKHQGHHHRAPTPPPPPPPPPPPEDLSALRRLNQWDIRLCKQGRAELSTD
jgi:hypothetical protein